MSEHEYKKTRERCQAEIGSDVVCSSCGGQIVPIETVDNARHPTFWPGCLSCSKFDYGVSKEVFRMARRLVENYRWRPYKSVHDSDSRWLESQTEGAANLVLDVLNEAKAEGWTPGVKS